MRGQQVPGRRAAFQIAPAQYSPQEEQLFRQQVADTLDLIRREGSAHAGMKSTLSQRGMKRYVFLAMARGEH